MTCNTNGLISRCTTPPATLTINVMLLTNYPLNELLAEVGQAQNGHWIIWVHHQKQLTEQFCKCIWSRTFTWTLVDSFSTKGSESAWMRDIILSLLCILYISSEVSVHMCHGWLNVPGGGRHLTQWRPLFSLADAESAITAQTITTPRSAQQAVRFTFCQTCLSQKISRALLKWRNSLRGMLSCQTGK